MCRLTQSIPTKRVKKSFGALINEIIKLFQNIPAEKLYFLKEDRKKNENDNEKLKTSFFFQFKKKKKICLNLELNFDILLDLLVFLEFDSV